MGDDKVISSNSGTDPISTVSSIKAFLAHLRGKMTEAFENMPSGRKNSYQLFG